jgi:pilus assembly protein CpaB
VEQGEVILKSYFREVSLEVGTTLPPGQMAATLRVDDVGGVAGLIRPGDHVDVIGTLPLPARAAGGGGEVTTRRLLTNCTVLAVDNRTAQTLPSTTSYGRGALPYSTVTLIVSAREAALLAFVQSQGKITLSLRNRTDAAEADEPPEIGLQNVRDEAVRANAERKAKQAATDPSRP